MAIYSLTHPVFTTAEIKVFSTHGHIQSDDRGWRDASGVQSTIALAENPGVVPSTHTR